MLDSSLEARLSALLFFLSSFLYLLISWLLWPIIIQVPTSFTSGPPKLSIFLFCRTVFSTPWRPWFTVWPFPCYLQKLLLTFFNWLTAQTLLLCYIYYSKKMDILHNSDLTCILIDGHTSRDLYNVISVAYLDNKMGSHSNVSCCLSLRQFAH